MFIFLSTIITLSLGIVIISVYSPIVLGFWILMISMIVSILLRGIFFSWFGFIIFLIYIGGILVIFSYFIAIQPNQYINIKTPFFYFMLGIFNLPINIYPVLSDLFKLSNWWVSSLFHLSNLSLLIVLGLILFLALVSVVKLTINRVGPLRPFTFYV